jgi:hypothetical protein
LNEKIDGYCKDDKYRNNKQLLIKEKKKIVRLKIAVSKLAKTIHSSNTDLQAIIHQLFVKTQQLNATNRKIQDAYDREEELERIISLSYRSYQEIIKNLHKEKISNNHQPHVQQEMSGTILNKSQQIEASNDCSFSRPTDSDVPGTVIVNERETVPRSPGLGPDSTDWTEYACYARWDTFCTYLICQIRCLIA